MFFTQKVKSLSLKVKKLKIGKSKSLKVEKPKSLKVEKSKSLLSVLFFISMADVDCVVPRRGDVRNSPQELTEVSIVEAETEQVKQFNIF